MGSMETEIQNEGGAGPSPPSRAEEGQEPMTVDESDGEVQRPPPTTYSQLDKRLKKILDDFDFLVQRNLSLQISFVAVSSSIVLLSDPDVDGILLDRNGEDAGSPGGGNFSSQVSSSAGSKPSSQLQETEKEVIQGRYEALCLELEDNPGN